MPQDTDPYALDVETDNQIVVPDLDVALFRVLEGFDYESQLLAIRDLLQLHRHSNLSREEEIRKSDEFARRTTGIVNQYAVDEWVGHMQASVYQDAAHSMAAVGMLAPLVESILFQSFNGIGRILSADKGRFGSHPRWQRPTKKSWDCHYFYASNGRHEKHFVEGVFQLAEAVGLSAHLPTDLKLTLQALFEYRNKMFHGGFEWPSDEREKFRDRIKSWPSDWFSMATQDHKPWIFYMIDTFIAHCLASVDRVLGGVGSFARDEPYYAPSLCNKKVV